MANFKELLGDKFKEDMSATDLLSALNCLDLSQTEEYTKLKDAVSTANTEAAKYKKQLKEKSTTDEQAAAAQKEIQDQLAALQKENQQMKLKESFIGNGYDAKTASTLAEAYASGDMTKFATLNATFMADQKKGLEASIKEELLKNTPGLQGGGAGGAQGGAPGEQSNGEKFAQMFNQQFAPAPAANAAVGAKTN